MTRGRDEGDGGARLGRAGRGLWSRSLPQPRLAAAGFLASLREGGVADAARAELLDGRVAAKTVRRAAEASLLASVRGSLEGALRAAARGAAPGEVALVSAAPSGVAGTAAGAAIGTAYAAPVEVITLALVRLGPESVLRPDLALLARPRRWGPGPPPSDLIRAGGGVEAEAVVLAVELATADAGVRQSAESRSSGRSPAQRGTQTAWSTEARLAAYAAAGVREVWSVDVRRGWTEAYRSPWGGAYRSRTLWYPGEAVPVTGLTDVAVETLGAEPPWEGSALGG
ncbi:MAG: Uma2 family endonuclease [Trueperaceae bacterium]|nr:Uma2 family endonuclease [Trueperaceae bacterium]